MVLMSAIVLVPERLMLSAVTLHPSPIVCVPFILFQVLDEIYDFLPCIS